MQRQLIAGAAIAALSCVASTRAAGAQDEGFYAGLGFGKASTGASTDLRGSEFADSGGSYRLLVGYSFVRYFGLELDYIDGGTAKDFVGPYELELKTTSTIASFVGTWSIGRWDLSAKAGYAFYDTKQTMRLGSVVESGSNDGEAAAGALAVGFNFNDRYSLRAEYEAIILDDGYFNNVSLIGIYRF